MAMTVGFPRTRVRKTGLLVGAGNLGTSHDFRSRRKHDPIPVDYVSI